MHSTWSACLAQWLPCGSRQFQSLSKALVNLCASRREHCRVGGSGHKTTLVSPYDCQENKELKTMHRACLNNKANAALKMEPPHVVSHRCTSTQAQPPLSFMGCS
eukprot:6478557-Amphidinium_carterae.1